MNTKMSSLTHFQIGLFIMAGGCGLVLAWQNPASLTTVVRACYVVYGLLFLAGSLAYYIKPRVGAAILVGSMLSLVLVAPLAGFPVWNDASIAARIGMIIGAIVAAGIVSEPFLKSEESTDA